MNYTGIRAAAVWCIANGIDLPAQLAADIEQMGLVAVKALQEYDNALTRIVSIYLNELRTRPGLTGANFGVDFANAISDGLAQAWRDGMRENDATEMLEEWQETLDGIIASERMHIPDFAYYLTEVAGNAETMGEAITQASGRLALWIGRYEDVRNQAILATAEEKTKLIWIYGDTEHCDTCQQLNGIVAYAREWEEAGIRPQSPPNGLLSCAGWHCQCELRPTTKRHARGALERLLAIAGQQGGG